MSIYEDLIMDHYRNPRNYGTLTFADKVIEVSNPFCGDKLKMEIQESNGVIENIGFSGEGCAISIAATSLLTEFAKGKKIKKILDFNRDDMIGLLKIKLTPARIKCALLGWEGLMNLVRN